MTDRFIPPPFRDQWIALAVATLCALAFLRTAVLPTKALLPYPPELLERLQGPPPPRLDPAVFRGNLTMGDKFNQSLTWDRITADGLRSGDLPLWTRDIGGGVPFVPQMGQVYHPANLLLLAFPPTGVYGAWYLLHMVLFGFFAYRFLRRIAVSHGAAVFGMVALILGLWAQARVHHNVMLSAALPVFAALSCTHHLLRHRGGAGHVGLLALCIAASWLSGFAPGSLMCTYLVCGYAVALALTAPQGFRVGPLLRFGSGVALGLVLAAVQLVPVLQAAAVTSRGVATPELLTGLCLELDHLATAVWPTLFAWPAEHFYPDMAVRPPFPALGLLEKLLYDSGFNYPETAFYLGLAPLACAFGAGRRDRGAWFFAAAALFGYTMASGWWLPVSRFLPGAHSGDVKRFLLLVGVCTPVVAALGLDRLTTRGVSRVPLGLAAAITLLSGLLFALHLGDPLALAGFYLSRAEQALGLAPGTWREWIRGYPDEPAVNQAHLLALFLVATAVGLLLTAALWRPGRWTAPVLTALTALELLWHGAGTVVPVDTHRVTTPPPILGPILASTRADGVRPRLKRLMPRDDANPLHYPVWPNMAAFYGVEDLDSYSPLPKRRMEEFFLCLEPDEKGKVSAVLHGAGAAALRKEASLTHPLADLIGIEWVIAMGPLDLPGYQDRTPAGVPPPYRLYRRPSAMSRATFVPRMEVVADAPSRFRRLADPSHRPGQVVLLEDPAAPPAGGDPAAPAVVEVASHRDEEVVVRVRNAGAGYLRLADPYDPGWTATVDGTASTVFVADHYFRAVFLPAGDHEVVFRYNGLPVRGPQYASLLALLSILALLVLGWVLGRLRRRRTLPSDP